MCSELCCTIVIKLEIWTIYQISNGLLKLSLIDNNFNNVVVLRSAVSVRTFIYCIENFVTYETNESLKMSHVL